MAEQSRGGGDVCRGGARTSEDRWALRTGGNGGPGEADAGGVEERRARRRGSGNGNKAPRADLWTTRPDSRAEITAATRGGESESGGERSSLSSRQVCAQVQGSFKAYTRRLQAEAGFCLRV